MVPARIRDLLPAVDCRDVYEFLQLDRNATPKQLREAAEKEKQRIHNKGMRGPVWDNRKALADICITLFKSDASKREYDRALEETESRREPEARGWGGTAFDEAALESGWSSVSHGRIEDAVVIAGQLTGDHEEYSRFRITIAEMLIERRKYDKAIEFLSSCEVEEPSNAMYKAILGTAIAKKGTATWNDPEGTPFATSADQVAEAEKCLARARERVDSFTGYYIDLDRGIADLERRIESATRRRWNGNELGALGGFFFSTAYFDILPTVVNMTLCLVLTVIYVVSSMDPQWRVNAAMSGMRDADTGLRVVLYVMRAAFTSLFLPLVAGWKFFTNFWPAYKDHPAVGSAQNEITELVRRLQAYLGRGVFVLGAAGLLTLTALGISPLLTRWIGPAVDGGQGGSESTPAGATSAVETPPPQEQPQASDGAGGAVQQTPEDGSETLEEGEAVQSAASLEQSLALTPAQKRAIQRGLAAEGFDPGPADGVFGSGTREAIRGWQEVAGTLVSGHLTALEAERLGAAGSAVVAEGPSETAEPPRVVAGAEETAPVAAPVSVSVEDGAAPDNDRLATAATGTLAVTTNVAGAVVRVGGREHPLPAPGLELPRGTHEVEVSAVGYAPFKARVDVPRGQRASLDVPLKREASPAAARSLFEAGDYEAAADAAQALLQVEAGAGPAQLLLGRALYALDRFEDSVEPLRRAIALGERVDLDARHRHGVGNFRQDFCRGVLAFAGGEVTFRSEEDDSHNFLVAADRITDVEVVESIDGQPFRLASRVQDQGSQRRRLVEFVHRNVVRQVRSGNSRYSAVLACSDCDGSLGVQAALMRGGG